MKRALCLTLLRTAATSVCCLFCIAIPRQALAKDSVYIIKNTNEKNFKWKYTFSNRSIDEDFPLDEWERYRKSVKAGKKNKYSKKFGKVITRKYQFKTVNNRYINFEFSISRDEYEKAIKAAPIKSDTVVINRNCSNSYECLMRENEIIGISLLARHDLPAIAKHEYPKIRTIADSLFRAMESQHISEPREIAETIGNMVQTAIPYRVPKNFIGLLTPVETLVERYGDCDTKSLLAATLLAYYTNIKTVGVRIKRHYLLGVEVPVLKGDTTIQHNGRTFVLMEAAGPAFFRIGEIGIDTKKEISRHYDIQEYF